MARSPLAQNRPLLPQDPMIRGPRLESYVPGYIRDSDLESALVRYPRAGGRLIEKGVGALMDDPLGLVTGALSGVVDQARESGDPLSFLQDSAVALGLPVVESGERLASGDYEGLTQEEEEEARLLDALTVAELIPMVGLGVKGVTGALRRRLRVENPGMDDAEIEAMVAQMELEATRPDPGGEDLGPRPEQLGLEEFEAGNVPMATQVAGDMETFGPGFTTSYAESLRGMAGVGADEVFDYVDQALVRQGFNAEERRELLGAEFPDDERLAGIADEMPEMPDAGLDATRNELNNRLDTSFVDYFGDPTNVNARMDAIADFDGVVEDLTDLGYGGAEIFEFFDDAMVRGGYDEDQRRRLMDQVFPPLPTEPGQPLDPWQFVGDDAPNLEQNVLEGLEANLENPVFGPGAGDPLLPEDGFVPDILQDTPLHQLEAMDFSMTGNDTKLNSRLEEVLLDPSAPKKFKNKQEFINFLTNQKNGVTNAELEARGIEGLSDGPIDLNDPDVRRWVFRDPLKVRILEGPDTTYKSYFLQNAQNYRETVITLDGSPFDADMVNSGIVGDAQHFRRTQDSMGGPALLHMRTGEFEVVDPPTTEKPATVAGKTFHVGEIQSQATQNARDSRKTRKFLEQLGDGDLDYANSLLEGPFARIAELKSQIKDVSRINPVDPATYDRESKIGALNAQIQEVLSRNNLPDTFYDDVRQQLQDAGLFEETTFKSGDFDRHTRYYVGELADRASTVNVDDVGVGSLYQTDRITNIAVKQALEQAIDTGADFITFNRGDLVHGMTGGKLEGHQEYYDKILPKNVNKLLAKLEKQNKVKLPRLEKLKLRTESGPTLGRVLGFKLTPELKDIFKAGVQAFRRGGMVESRNLGLGSMSREVL